MNIRVKPKYDYVGVIWPFFHRTTIFVAQLYSRTWSNCLSVCLCNIPYINLKYAEHWRNRIRNWYTRACNENSRTEASGSRPHAKRYCKNSSSSHNRLHKDRRNTYFVAFDILSPFNIHSCLFLPVNYQLSSSSKFLFYCIAHDEMMAFKLNYYVEKWNASFG